MTTFGTADLHLGHENCASKWRPHITVSNMNLYIFNKWNSIVKKEDVVYVLGDLFLNDMKNPENMHQAMDILNGTIHLIPGNHDNISSLKRELEEKRTDFIIEPFIMEKKFPVQDKKSKMLPLVASHYPLASWSTVSKGVGHIHGHCHQNYKTNGRILDVGWDGGYEEGGKHIWTIDEIKEHMHSLEIYSIDYH